LGSEEEIMTVSLWIRETVGGKRRYKKPNKKRNYPEGTVFCLRYTANGKRRWETLHVISLNAALAARATKEAALLSEVPTATSPSAKRINVDDAIATYLSTVADITNLTGMERLVQESDVVVLATDNEPSRFRINEICVRQKIPLVVGRVFTRGIGGEVFSYRRCREGA
jgi:ThiF family